jgi:hypothetical protein
MTPILENTKSGYIIHGNALTDLNNSSLAAEEGLTVGGNIAVGGTVDGVDISALPTSFAPTDAEANVQANWTATSGDAFILNKPTTFAPSTHNHSANEITSGTLSTDRIPEFVPKYTYQTGTSGVFMPMVKGGINTGNASATTGRLRIRLPHYKEAIMQSFVVDVYEYNSNRFQSYKLGGYSYNDSNATWYNTSAIAIMDSDNRDLTVRFGSYETAGFQCVSIGEVDTVWSYPQVVVRDYLGGHSAALADFEDSFVVEFITTDLASYDQTHTNNQPFGDYNRLDNTPTIPTVPDSYAPTDAEANVQADWNATSGDALILNKPTIPTVPDSYAPTDAEANVQADWNASSGDALILNKPTTLSGYGITDSPNLHEWEWYWVRYADNVTPTTDTQANWEALYKTSFINETAAEQDEGYVNTIDDVGAEGGFGGSTYGNIFGNLSSYHTLITTNIHVTEPFTVSITDFIGDDSHAIFIDGAYVKGVKGCCTNSSYSYTFTQGWHRIDLIYGEGGGGDYIKMGWNPKDYTDNISHMYAHLGADNPNYTLERLKAIDGAGSGLDADLLDGQEGTHYLDYNNFSNTPTLPTSYAPINAEQNVQANWTETTTASDAFILNKPTTFAPSAHNQAWSTITSTPTTLGGYGITDAAASNHVHSYLPLAGGTLSGNLDVNADIKANTFTQEATGIPRNNLGSPTVSEMALFDNQFTPKTTLANSYDDLTDLTFWVQTTSSSAWTEVTTYSDDQKRRFLRTNNSSVIIPNGAYKFRVEFVGRGYTFANAMYAYWSSNSHNTQVHIWKYNVNSSSWLQHTSSSTTVSSWPGHLYLPFSTIPWLETATTHTGHFKSIRIEFTPNWSTGTYSDRNINLSGIQLWGGYPSGKRTVHSYDQNGRLNLYDDLNVPGDITVGGTVDGVDISALPTSFAPTDAEANVQANWTATSGDAFILNKPTTFAPSAHTHDDRYYTETESDARFLGISAKAADANLLDGINSTSFLRSDADDNFSGQLVNNSRNETPAYNKGAINLQPSTSGGSTGITFRSNVNSTSDAGYIWWFDDNDHYNELDSTENGVLLIAVQNDGGATSEDAIALESSGDIYLNPGVASGAIGSGTFNSARGNIFLGNASSRVRILTTTDGDTYSTATGVADNAEVNVQADWNATSGDALILNKPTIPQGDITSVVAGTNLSGGGTSGAVTLNLNADISLTSLNIGQGATLRESTDRADLLQITSVTSSWAGLQIRNSSDEGRWSFMTDGATAGFYDDQQNEWAVQMVENNAVKLYYNGAQKLTTLSTGVSITGQTTATNFRTNTSSTDWTGFSRNSAGNATLYVNAATSNTNQIIAQFNYGSAAANAGSQVLRVAKDKSYFVNSNLGVGTTDPTSRLTVDGGDVDITDNNILVDNQKGFVNSGAWTRNATPHGYIDIGPANTSYAHIYTDRPTFYFNKEIRVLGKQLFHSGSTAIGNLTSGTHGQQMERGNEAVTTLRFDADKWRLYAGASAGEVLSVKQTGQVGIGASSPGTYLQIGDYAGNNIDITTYPDVPSEHMIHLTAPETTGRYGGGISFGENTFTAANITAQDAGGNGSLHMLFGTRHTSGIVAERMRITSNGNVGIGTNSPGSKLEVNGDIDTTGSNGYLINGKGWALELLDVLTLGDWDGQEFSTRIMDNNSNEVLRVTDGNVGIGTSTPSDKLHVNGTVRSQAPTTSDWGFLGYNSAGTASSGLWFDNGSGDILLRKSDNSLQTRIRSTGSSYINGGNLGIGTTGPAQRLTINSGRMLITNNSTPIYIKVNSGYKSWVHHISSDDGYIFAPSTADGGETWDWANATKIGANGVVRAKNFVLSSDKRNKTKIEDLTGNNVDVSWKSFEMKGDQGEYRTGVIAQELEEKHPEFVNTDDEGFKSVKYIDLLIAKIAELEARLEKLEK